MSGPNDWQRRSWGGPGIADPLTTYDVGVGTTNDVECPNCRHLLAHHSVDLGCHVGWGSVDCPVPHDGCACPLSLALQHGPKREAEVNVR